VRHDPQLRRRIKLHFGNSDVDLDNAQDIAKVRAVFQAANKHHMAIVVHMHPSISHHRTYGAAEAQVVLDRLLAVTPEVSVQIAHLTGSGGYDPMTDAALGVFVEAIAKHDPRVRNVWFDVAAVIRPGMPPDLVQLVTKRIREIGPERVLYGSDAATAGNLNPREGWAAFRTLRLTNAEFRAIARNVPPYMRW
jgi:predicted TIM-barrel fold metal-dependent hydrolase